MICLRKNERMKEWNYLVGMKVYTRHFVIELHFIFNNECDQF